MMQAPRPRRDSRAITQLGRTRHDDFAWMKDENWQQVLRDPGILRADIAAHLREENAYAEAVLTDIEPLRAALVKEMIGRIPPAEESVPVPDGAWEYYARYADGAQHPLHARRPRGGGEETVLLDVDALAKQHPYYALGGAAHSDDHALYVYAEDVQGSEVYRIQVKDLASGALCAPPVESTTGAFAISPDSQWLFWTYRDDNGRPSRIYRRPIRGGEDVLVFDEPDAGFFLHIGVSASRKWVVIERGDHDTNETLLIPAADITAPPVTAAPLVRGERYSLTHWNDRFIILTNTQGAVDFQLMWTPANATDRVHWRSFVPHEAGRYLVGASACENYLAWAERRDGNVTIQIVPRGVQGNVREQATTIAVDEPAFDLTMLGALEYGGDVLRYIYESPTTPAHWYDYDMATHQRVLRKVREVPSGHDASQYVVQRLFAVAADGAAVPITALMRHDTSLDGSAPMLLYGYGSYGIAMDAGFSTTAFSLVDRGWVYAIAHVRGGSEKGWNWFLEGRGQHKPNTFTDFIACAKHLIAAGYGRSGRIVAHGGSAGGLLMGAVANLAPELFAGIAAQVPFVDMLNTMSDVTLPLTPPEWPEWGNPLEDEEAYDLIEGYSPYDNIGAKDYPPILAMGGLSDPRVTYWEPAKWIAKLRTVASGGPFLCRINMEAGHGGSSGRFKRLEEVALVQAFAIWAVARVNGG
ncbi:prolyl oligopeptidase [Neoasaia chiangmaiensis]|nr:S9 family peptidase [Neoasaia chiangmaiensis]GEN13746.1 prolyl oligopeptidase [Neoasaia chiangmaiensis]